MNVKRKVEREFFMVGKREFSIFAFKSYKGYYNREEKVFDSAN